MMRNDRETSGDIFWRVLAMRSARPAREISDVTFQRVTPAPDSLPARTEPHRTAQRCCMCQQMAAATAPPVAGPQQALPRQVTTLTRNRFRIAAFSAYALVAAVNLVFQGVLATVFSIALVVIVAITMTLAVITATAPRPVTFRMPHIHLRLPGFRHARPGEFTGLIWILLAGTQYRRHARQILTRRATELGGSRD